MAGEEGEGVGWERGMNKNIYALKPAGSNVKASMHKFKNSLLIKLNMQCHRKPNMYHNFNQVQKLDWAYIILMGHGVTSLLLEMGHGVDQSSSRSHYSIFKLQPKHTS